MCRRLIIDLEWDDEVEEDTIVEDPAMVFQFPDYNTLTEKFEHELRTLIEGQFLGAVTITVHPFPGRGDPL